MPIDSYLTSIITICAYAWPDMPQIASHYIALELLRMVGLFTGIGTGLWLIGIGLFAEL